MFRKDDVVRHLWNLIDRNLERHAITLFRGDGRFEDPHTITVTSRDGQVERLRAGVILIATGSSPAWPEGVPHDPRLFDSDTILRMERIPRSLVVIGAGVIGCEYATMFRAMGVEVTLVCSQDRLLPFLDGELSERLRLQTELLGLHVLRNEGMGGVELDGPEVTVRLKGGGGVQAECVLFATGRSGATAGLGLERAGLAAGPRGHLSVNGDFQTAVPHIYAAGDVIGFPALASTSMDQGRVAMCHAFDLKYKTQVSSLLPMAVYTIPELAAVGETEESASKKGLDFVVGRAYYEGNSRGQIIGDFSGFVKLVVAREDRRLLGVHVLGELASELIHVGQAQLQHGGTLEHLIDTVFNYPTLGEAYKYAAYDALGAIGAGRLREADR
jgi:NAD(P) transhydrogenase